MARNLSHDLKRIIAGMCALLIVSGSVPAQPIADVFNTALTASAGAPTGESGIEVGNGGNTISTVVTLTNNIGNDGTRLQIQYGESADTATNNAEIKWNEGTEPGNEKLLSWSVPAGSYVKIQSRKKPIMVGNEQTVQGENEWTYVWEGYINEDIDIDYVYSKLTNAAGIEFTEAYFINDGPEPQNTDLEFNNGVAEVPYGSYVYLSSEQYYHVGRWEANEDLEGYYYSFNINEDTTISFTGTATLTNTDEILFNEAKFSDSKRDFDEGNMGDIEFSENAAVLGADSYVYLKASDAFKVGEEEAELVGEDYIWQGFIHTNTEITKVEEAEEDTTYVTALAPFADTESEFSPDTDLPGFTPLSVEDVQNWDGAPSGRVYVIYDVSDDKIHMSSFVDGQYNSDIEMQCNVSKSAINEALADGIKIYYFSDTAKTLEVGQYIGVKDTIALEGDTYGKIGEDTVKLNVLADENGNLVLTDMLYADGISFKGYIAYINDDHDVYFPADEEDPTISGFYVTGGSGTEEDPFTFDLKVPQNKSPITPTVTIEGWEYNEVPNEPVVTGNTGNGAVTYTYYRGVRNKSTSEFTYTEIGPNAPTGVGNYKVVATIAETEEYLGATAETTFVVDRAEWDFEASAKTGLVYNGKDQLLMTVTETNEDAWSGIVISTEAPNRLVTSNLVNANILNVGDVLCPSKFDEIMIGNANYGHGSLILKTDNEDINVSRIYYEGNKFRVNSFSDDKEHGFDGYDSLIVTKVEGGDAFVELHNYNAEIDNVSSKWRGYYYDEDPDYTEDNYPTAKNAGEYTLYWTRNADANHNGLKGVVTANIAKAPATVKTAPTAVTGLKYDGTEKDLVTAGAASGGKMMYTLDAIPQVYSTNNADTSDLNVGDIIRPVDYSGLNVEGTFILEGNEYTDTINVYVDDRTNTFEIMFMDSQGETKTYQADEADSLIVTDINDGVVTFELHKFDEETDLARNWTDFVPKAKNACTYTVYYKAASEDDNHIDSDVGSVDVTIAKADALVKTAPTAVTGLGYDGTEKDLVTAGAASGGKMMYTLDAQPKPYTTGTVDTSELNVGDVLMPTARNSGVRVTGPFYYNDVLYTPKENDSYLMIEHNYDYNEEEGIEYDDLYIYTWIYDEDIYEYESYSRIDSIIITDKVNGIPTIELHKFNEETDLAGNRTWIDFVPKAKNAGTYTVYYKAAGDENYTDSAEGSVDVTIAKASVHATITGNKYTGAYDGQEHSAVGYEIGNFDNTLYDPNNFTFVGDNAPTARGTNVGSYSMGIVETMFRNADTNFEVSVNITDGGVIITKLTPAVSSFTVTLPDAALEQGERLTYDGQPKAATVTSAAVAADNITVMYRNGGDENWTTDVPVNAGTYQVGVTVVGTTNYDGVTDVLTDDSWTFTIAQAQNGIKTRTVLAQDLVYDGQEHALLTNGGAPVFGTYEYRIRKNGMGDDEGWSSEIPKGTNAGVYTVECRVVETENYTGMLGGFGVTIAKADITPIVTINGWTYGSYDEAQNAPSIRAEVPYWSADDTTYEYKVKGADDSTYTATVPTNAGEYTVRAIVAESQNFEPSIATADFTIAKADPGAPMFDITLPTGDDLVYSGTAKSVTAAPKQDINGMGEVTVKYYSDAERTQEVEPINAGTYYVGIEVAEGTNYNASSGVLFQYNDNWKFTIAKADPGAPMFDITLPTGDALVYNGEAKSATVAPKQDVNGVGTVTVHYYSDPDRTQEVQAANVKNAGTYYVGITVAEGDNYNAASSVIFVDNDSWKFTIAKADPGAPMFDITLPTGDDLVYDGTAKSVTAAPKELIKGMGEVTVKYYTTEERKANSEVTSPTNAGTYYVGIEVAEGTNYNASSGALFQYNDDWKFTIAKADPAAPMFDITLPTGDDLVYDGTAKSVTAAPKQDINGMGEVTVKYYSDAERTQEVEPINAGTYYVGVTVTEGTNYNEVTADDVLFQNNDDWTFTIDKAELSQADLILVAPEDTTYDGTAKVPAVVLTNGRTGLGTPTFTYENITTNEQNLSQAVDAGEYYVTVSFTDGDNFYATNNAIGDDSWSFSIAQAAANVQVTPVADLKYDGTPKNLLTVNANYGTMEYKLAGDTNWSQGIPQQTKAGTYNISWRYTNDNYETASGDSTVTISPKTVSVTWSNTELVYNGTEKKPTAQLDGVVQNDDCTVTVSGGQTEEGSYTATAALDGDDKDNYALDDTATSDYSIILSGEVEAATAKRFVNALNSAGVTKITLTADIDPTRIEDFYGVNTNRDLTIDLNGHKLDNGYYDDFSEETVAGTLRSAGGTLTITDSSEDQTGKIINIDDFMADGGNIVIDGGSYEMTDIGFSVNNNDTVTIKGGSFQINDGNGTWDENWDAYLAEDMEVVARENADGWYDVVDADKIEDHVKLSITKPAATVNSKGEGRVTATVTRQVDEGYTIVETGILYVKDASVEDELTLENKGVNGISISKAENSNGAKTLHAIDTNGKGAKFRGYIIVSNGHKSQTIYTDTVSAKYADLYEAAFADAAEITISEPIATVNSKGVGRVTATVTRQVNDGFTIVDAGILYVKDVSNTDELTVDKAGTNGIGRSDAEKTGGAKTLHVTDPEGKGARIRGFITVSNGTLTKTFYTDTVSATYNKLLDEVFADAAEITISEPIATVNAKGVGRVTATVTRQVNDGFTIVDAGILYVKDVSNTDELTVDKVGTNGIGRSDAEKTGGAKTLHVTDPEGKGARIRGFITVSNGTLTKTFYTDTVSGTYEGLKEPT